MLTRSNLRKDIEEKSEKQQRKYKFSTKRKLNNKENAIVNSNQAEFNKPKFGRKKLLCSPVLKNKSVKRILRERNNYESTLDKIPSAGSDNKCKTNCKKQRSNLHKSKLPVLQENNLNGKSSSNSIVKKTKRSKNANKEGIKNHKIETFFSPANSKFEKTTKQSSACEEKNHNIETSTSDHPVTSIPIWKRQLNLNKSNYLKKHNGNVDVYDIDQDEDLRGSDEKVRKKPAHSQKRKVNKNAIKKNDPSTKNKTCKLSHSSSDPDGKRKTLEIDDLSLNKVNKKTGLPEVKKHSKLLDKNMNLDFEEQNVRLEPFLEDVQLNSHFSEPKSQSNKFLLDLVNELEISFSIPKMTSTPDALHIKPGPSVQNDTLLNVPSITDVNENITVIAPCDTVCESHSPEKAKGKRGLADITLFESPAKDEEEIKKRIKPNKKIQLTLFDVLDSSLTGENNLEESVLKPKKAYHTPDNFKTHVARAKRAGEKTEKEILKKSKEDMLIEKMNKHFEEINSSVLCVE